MKTKKLIQLPVAALAALFCATTPGVASILLSTENFALLAGADITSTGATLIDGGNVATWGGTNSVIGFPPGLIEQPYGIIGAGSVTDQARDDLITLRNGLAGMQADETLVALGGQTLLPGVYHFGAAANLTGNLILDGNGQDNAYWVFQIGAAFTTAADSSVTVVNTGNNGGSDYGVFWNVQDAITFGANSEFLGNYLAGATITMGALSHGSGRALTMGAISIDSSDLHAFGGLGGSDWSGGLMYDQGGFIVAVPEPAASAAIFGLAMLIVVFTRRHLGNRKA
jgi:hypothetical protein